MLDFYTFIQYDQALINIYFSAEDYKQVPFGNDISLALVLAQIPWSPQIS